MADGGWVATFGKKGYFTREPESGVKLEVQLRIRGWDARIYVKDVLEIRDYDHKHRADYKKATHAAEILYSRWLRSIGRAD